MRKSEARKVVMGRWTDYVGYLAEVRVLPTLDYARTIEQRAALSPEQRAQVRAMISRLEETARLFCGPITYRLVSKLERALQGFAGVLINLSAWDNDDMALKFWAKEILGDPREWTTLAEIATTPLLEGHQNWTGAERAVPYLAQATRIHRDAEERRYQANPREVPLDQAAEPVAAELAPSDEQLEEAFKELLRGADSEVQDYGVLILRGYTQDEARRQLSWYRKRVQRVDVRYRRHLKRAARDRDRQTLRQILDRWRADASRTVDRRTFHDDDTGRRYDYFEHKEDWKDRDEM